ncbi:hypothetical protein GE21DRAFT_1309055 [Neurospora crassa]|nr:hypothetical protein GE21DRAFT_1309055 [Neurospora crassa]
MRRYRGGKTQEGGVGMQQAMQALRPVRIPLQRSPCVLDVWACLETPRWRVTEGGSQGCSGASATHALYVPV